MVTIIFAHPKHSGMNGRIYHSVLEFCEEAGIDMSELNGNEKYCYLPDKLPTDSRQVENINVGDLMLYGSDCLVLFYESFSTSYSYTRLGYIEDTSGLSATLGSGSAEVTFAVGD